MSWSLALHPSFLMSSVALSRHLQAPHLLETQTHTLSPCLLSEDRHPQPSSTVSRGRGVIADLPSIPQEQKHTLLGCPVKQPTILTHPLWEDGEGPGGGDGGELHAVIMKMRFQGKNQRLQTAVAQSMLERLSQVLCAVSFGRRFAKKVGYYGRYRASLNFID